MKRLVLTIAGYSINDTVVIFDRVRENLRKYKKLPLPELLNKSLNQTLTRTLLTSITTLLADAGYDSEAAHVFAREQFGIRTIIPATRGRPTKKRLKGRWRNQMKTRFNRPKYGQRWQVETVMSMIKRRLGETLSARSYRRQCRAMLLKVIAHNILILFRLG